MIKEGIWLISDGGQGLVMRGILVVFALSAIVKSSKDYVVWGSVLGQAFERTNSIEATMGARSLVLEEVGSRNVLAPGLGGEVRTLYVWPRHRLGPGVRWGM